MPLQFTATHPKQAVLNGAVRHLLNMQRVVLLACDQASSPYVEGLVIKQSGEGTYHVGREWSRDTVTPFENRSLYYIAPRHYPMSHVYGPVRQHVFARQKAGERVRIVELHTNAQAAHFAADYWGCEVHDIGFDEKPYREYFAREDEKLRAELDILPRYGHPAMRDIKEPAFAGEFGNRKWLWKTPAGHMAYRYDQKSLLEIDKTTDTLLLAKISPHDHMVETKAPFWSKAAQKAAADYAADLSTIIEARNRLMPDMQKINLQIQALGRVTNPMVFLATEVAYLNYEGYASGHKPYNQATLDGLRKSYEDWARRKQEAQSA